MKITVQAMSLEVEQEELKSHVPKELLEKIKGKGVLQAYTLAQEGISQPRVIGEGTQRLKWTRAVIHRLSEKIKQGTKFFVGHGEDNSHENRKDIGEVVGSFVKEIKGKLSDIVIGYFPEKDKVKELDVCSMEADVHVEEEIVSDVNEVSGIALGNSRVDSPAFPGALRLATVQCFENEPGEGEKEMAITFRDVVDFIKERNVFPHQVFNKEDLKNDREFSGMFDEISKLESEKETLSKELEELKKSKDELEGKVKGVIIKEKFDKLLPEDLTEKQKVFITTRFDASKITETDDESIKKYIEEEKKIFAETAKLFGVTDTSQSGKSSESSKGTSEQEGDPTPEEEALKLLGVE